MAEEGGFPSLMMSKPKLLLSALNFSSKSNHVTEELEAAFTSNRDLNKLL
jgi:hypothetical protein